MSGIKSQDKNLFSTSENYKMQSCMYCTHGCACVGKFLHYEKLRA